MNEDAFHTQRIRHQTGVLSSGTAEAVQRVASHVITALNRDLLDGVCHVLDCDLEKSVGHFHRRSGISCLTFDAVSQLGKYGLYRSDVQPLILTRPEDRWEELFLQLAQHHVAIGHRQRATAPVTHRPGIGSGRLWANPVPGAVKSTDRSAPGRDCMDQHHRRPHADPGHLSLKGAFEFTVVVGDIRRGSAHIKGDDPVVTRIKRCLNRTNDPPCGPGKNRVLAAKQAGVGEPTIGLHEHQTGFSQFPRDPGDIVAQHG